MVGWIYGKDVPNVSALSAENAKLRNQNDKLRVEVEKFKREKNEDLQINKMNYYELKSLLSAKKIEVSKSVTKDEEIETNVLKLFLGFNDKLNTLLNT